MHSDMILQQKDYNLRDVIWPTTAETERKQAAYTTRPNRFMLAQEVRNDGGQGRILGCVGARVSRKEKCIFKRKYKL